MHRVERGIWIGRLAVGVFLGLLLGVLGLPRLELRLPLLPGVQPADGSLPSEVALVGASPTLPPVLTTAPVGPGVRFAERFVAPLPGWPNNSRGNAWFDDGAYHLMARDPGRFVALGVPLTEALGDGAISAQFHKVGGPSGGGYGLIIREQGRTGERDSRSQAGSYLVLEVGDQGDVAIWQRDDTRWVDVLQWRHADSVHTDTDPNLLVVYTRGPVIRFEVNGELVAEMAVDGIPTRGNVGIFVGGDLNEAALEWLRVEAL